MIRKNVAMAKINYRKAYDVIKFIEETMKTGDWNRAQEKTILVCQK